MVPGGAAPRRLNVNGIKPTTGGDVVIASTRSPSAADDSAASCFTLSTSPSIGGGGVTTSTSRTLPCRAAVPPPPPPKPLWPTASRQRALTEDRRRENEQLTAASAAGHRRHPDICTPLEDGGVMTASHSQPVPLTSWGDQTAATMPMLAEERTIADDVTETRGATIASSPGTGCSGAGGKVAMLFLVAIPVIGIVAAALAWFYSCRQVSWTHSNCCVIAVSLLSLLLKQRL